MLKLKVGRILSTGQKLAVLAGLISCVTVIGCNRHGAPKHIYVGLDASGSARPCIGNYVLMTQGISEQLAAGIDSLTIYRMERETREFSDGVYDGDAEAHLKTMVEEIRKLSSDLGTLPADFWQRVAARAETDKQPTYIFLMSDGDNDDMRPSSWDGLHKAALRLANCNHVQSVVFCGASADNWERIRKTFAPLKERLHLLSPTQLQPQAAVSLLDNAQFTNQ